MAHYIIGDVQGCFDELMALLDTINFDESSDTLWFCGDLINRGPKSIETLEFIMNCKRAQTVLGNHDIHFLALTLANRKPFAGDTLASVVSDPRAETWCDWLCQQPLLLFNEEHNATMVHAGVLPCWSLSEAKTYAQEVERKLKDPTQRIALLDSLFGNEPNTWDPNLTGMARLRFIANVFTRMRFCFDERTLELTCKTPVGEQPDNLHPWFTLRSDTSPIYFGHWAALGDVSNVTHFHATDTGCVWGKALTALRLDDHERFSVLANRNYKT